MQEHTLGGEVCKSRTGLNVLDKKLKRGMGRLRCKEASMIYGSGLGWSGRKLKGILDVEIIG